MSSAHNAADKPSGLSPEGDVATDLIQQARTKQLDAIGGEIREMCREVSYADKDEAEQSAKQLVQALDGHQLSGKSPRGVAAGAVYLAQFVIGEEVNQREIANVSNISSVTIRERYQELADAVIESGEGPQICGRSTGR